MQHGCDIRRQSREFIAAAIEDTRSFFNKQRLEAARNAGAATWRFWSKVDLFDIVMRRDGPRIGNVSSFKPAAAANLIDAAQAGDGDADTVLHELAADLNERGEPLPEPLRLYIVACARGENEGVRKKKRTTHSNGSRDSLIALAVDRLASRQTFRGQPVRLYPTRNDATRDLESASSIVAQVLADLGVDVGEDSVNKIWRARQSWFDVDKIAGARVELPTTEPTGDVVYWELEVPDGRCEQGIRYQSFSHWGMIAWF
jgi:hypothetical protein